MTPNFPTAVHFSIAYGTSNYQNLGGKDEKIIKEQILGNSAKFLF